MCSWDILSGRPYAQDKIRAIDEGMPASPGRLGDGWLIKFLQCKLNIKFIVVLNVDVHVCV